MSSRYSTSVLVDVLDRNLRHEVSLIVRREIVIFHSYTKMPFLNPVTVLYNQLRQLPCASF